MKRVKVGPGRPVPVLGECSEYFRRMVTADSFFCSVETSHDPEMFETFTVKSLEDFNDFLALAREELETPINISIHFSEADTYLCKRRSVAHLNKRCFSFFHLLRGINYGGVGFRFMAHLYGLSKGTVPNYIRHVR